MENDFKIVFGEEMHEDLLRFYEYLMLKVETYWKYNIINFLV